MKDITGHKCFPWYFELLDKIFCIFLVLHFRLLGPQTKNHLHICINLVLIIIQILVWIAQNNFRKVEFSCNVQLPRSNFHYPII